VGADPAHCWGVDNWSLKYDFQKFKQRTYNCKYFNEILKKLEVTKNVIINGENISAKANLKSKIS
jgi:hypothetical protein